MNKVWSINDAPDLTGRRAVVTGANTGLGYETAKALAAKGCHTILACRDREKAEAARRAISDPYPEATVDVLILDTGSIASVRSFAENFRKDYDSLDILINNAGIMTTPYFQTEEGFEGQLAVNYLGHFLLTGLLLPSLEAAPAARVVTLYSLAHRLGGIQFDDIHFARGYEPGKSYYQSKMACLMFALELNQRLIKAGHKTRSVAAHPGMSQSDLYRHLPRLLRMITGMMGSLLLQPAEQGALPALYAALSGDIRGGETIGPGGVGQRKGAPRLVEVEESAHRQADRNRLWTMTEEMLGFSYKL
jgi:NAD(P)-dependent dehydrogenase (short-subunit alcohol dehydrogenase family)